MGRRMWMALGAVAVVLAPAACGTTDGGDVATGPDEATEQGGAVPVGPTVAFMGQVAVTTAEAPAFEMVLTMAATDSPELGSGPLLSARGTFTGDGSRGQMSFDLSGLLGAMGGTSAGAPASPLGDLLTQLAEPLEVVVDGDTTYLRGGPLGALLGAGTTWVSMPTGTDGADPTGGLSDPTQLLAMLGEAGEVTEVGPEDIGGTPTTRYAVVVDVEAMAASAAAESGVELPPMAGLDGGEITIDVWVDEATEQVRRMQLEMDGASMGAGLGGEAGGSVQLTIDLTPLDQAPAIEVPDPADVTAADDLGGGLFGGLGGLGG